MAPLVRIKEEPVSVAPLTRLPDPAALMCRKLMSCPSLSLSALVEGSDAERAEKTQLCMLQLSKCHQSERFNLAADAEVFCTLLRSASIPLQVMVCELLNAYIKAVHINFEIPNNEEGIRSAGDLLAFYRRIHDDMVAHALPNVKAGDQCALFICNLISICSSRRVFVDIVDAFGSSIGSLLPNMDSNGSSVEISTENARQVIGIMKTLLSLTKAFGTPPAPSKELCNIASSVIRATKNHLCRLYSYNVIAFLLRKVNSEEAVKTSLPNLTAGQLKQVMTLLKEANHLKDTYEWSFQHTAVTPVQHKASESMDLNATEKEQSSSLPIQQAYNEVNEVMTAENATFTPHAVNRHNFGCRDTALTAVVKGVSTADTVRTSAATKASIRNTRPSKADAETRKVSGATTTHDDSSLQQFKPEWTRILVAQFVDTRHGPESATYNREAWKGKQEVLTNVVEKVQRVGNMLNLGPCTAQVITVLENILQFESAIPLVLSGLRLLDLLLEKSEENLSRNGKALHLFDLVYDRLKDTNNKVQGAAIRCVAWIITRSEGYVNVDLIKRALMHKSPLARIAMCSIIGGSVALPDNADGIPSILQEVKWQLMPMIESLISDKNVKVRNAAIECKRILDDHHSVKARVMVSKSSDSVVLPAKPVTQNTVCSSKIKRRPTSIVVGSLPAEETATATTNNAACETDLPPPAAAAANSTGVTKRKLVRRFLKHSALKRGKVNRESTRCQSSETRFEGTHEADSVTMLNESTTDNKTDGHMGGITQQGDCVAPLSPEFGSRVLRKDNDTNGLSCVNEKRRSLTASHPDVAICKDVDLAQSHLNRSSSEEFLLRHIPDSILNKVAKRGSFRRSLSEGLYELLTWMHDHRDIAAGYQTHILRFVGECTNGYREHTKTGRTAVYSFLEDFVRLDISVECVELLVTSLSADISNEKAADIMKLLIPRCEVNMLIVKILDANQTDNSMAATKTVLSFLSDLVSSIDVDTLLPSVVHAVVKYCSPLSGNANSEVSQLAHKLMNALDMFQQSSATRELETSKRVLSQSKPMFTELFVSDAPEVANSVTPSLQCMDIPTKLSEALKHASTTLQKAISRDLFECMFQSGSKDNLQRACGFWDMYLQQTKDSMGDLLFGDGNVRCELIIWLCHTLLLGVSEGMVVRCIDHVFGKIKHVGSKLSLDEAIITIEALSLFNERNAGDALLLFDHMMQVTDVTTELLRQCPSTFPWTDAIKDLVVCSPIQSNSTVKSCQQQIVISTEDEAFTGAALTHPESAPTTNIATSETRVSLHDVVQSSPQAAASMECKPSSVPEGVDSVKNGRRSVDVTYASLPSTLIATVENATSDVKEVEHEMCDTGTLPKVDIHRNNQKDQSPLSGGKTKDERLRPSLIPDDLVNSDKRALVRSNTDDTDIYMSATTLSALPRSETIDEVGGPPVESSMEEEDFTKLNAVATVSLSESLKAEDDEEDYGHYPEADLQSSDYKCTYPVQASDITTTSIAEPKEIITDLCRPQITPPKEMSDVGIQTSPPTTKDVDPYETVCEKLEITGDDSKQTSLDGDVSNRTNGFQQSYGSSVVVESARSSISRILSQHLKCGGLHPTTEATALMERYMKLVEGILSDCSYIANFCLLSNYQDYRSLLPSLYDDGMMESCVERAQRILENLTMFSDQHITQALSPVLLDACHISILQLCKEIEKLPQLSALTDKVIDAIVYLLELFTIATVQLDGRSLLQYCAVVIHCLALPKQCFHRNIRLYNGLSRLISVNALEQTTDVLARLLVICLELSVQSLRRGDGGRILLAMLRLTKILQSQIAIHLKEKEGMSPVSRSELCKSHSTYVSLLKEYLRGSSCKSSLEPRLNDALHQSNALLHSLCEIA